MRHKTRWALRLAKVIGLGALTAPGIWRAKAAAQLPREWLDFESIMCATSTPKLAPEHGPFIGAVPFLPHRDSRVFVGSPKSWVRKVLVNCLECPGGDLLPSRGGSQADR